VCLLKELRLPKKASAGIKEDLIYMHMGGVHMYVKGTSEH
jgi:hypothetical protein